MATGRLGTPADMSATTNTTLYECPSSTFSVATVSLCNRNSSAVDIRLAVSTSGSPTNAEYIEYDAELVANGVLERTGIVLAAGQRIVAYASSTGVSGVVYGIETPTV